MSRRLLLVDDDENFTRVLSRGLSRRGLVVEVAANARDALARAREFDPEWILLDLKLGDDNGLAVLGALKESCPRGRIVLGTGYASIATAVDALRRGAFNYLAKPFDIDALLRAFEDVTEGGAPVPVPDRPPALRRLGWEHIQRVLAEYDGNVSRAAEALGIHRRTLQRRLAKRPVREK